MFAVTCRFMAVKRRLGTPDRLGEGDAALIVAIHSQRDRMWLGLRSVLRLRFATPSSLCDLVN